MVLTASLMLLPPSAEEISRVGNRPAPVRSGGQTIKAEHDAEQAPDIPCVAIGIPARGVDDDLRAMEVVGCIEHSHDHQRMVWHDMTIARVFVIAIVIFDLLPCRPPNRGSLLCQPRTSATNLAMRLSVGMNLSPVSTR